MQSTSDVGEGLTVVHEICSRVEAELNVPPGFVFRLPSETDWTFLVKAGAIAEAAVNQLVLTAVEDARLHRVLSRMRLRGPDGRLALAKDLDLLSGAESRFVERVAQLRNSAVHDVSSFSITFRSLLDRMAPPEQASFWRDLLGVATADFRQISSASKLPEAAKFTIWIALVFFLGGLQRNRSSVSFRQRHDALQRETDAKLASTFRELLAVLDQSAAAVEG